MISKTFSVALALGVSTVVSMTAAGQEPPVQHVVRSIQESGSISSTLKHVIIRGCPQDDAYDRAIIDAVSKAPIPSGAVAELALLWRRPFAECAYGPLDTWVERALVDLSREDNLSAFISFVRHVTPVLTDGLRDVVWTVIETRPLIEDAIAAFRRPVPTEWKTSTTYYLGREFGAGFFRTVAREAPNLDDATLFIISSAIGSDVRDGHVNPNAAGLSELRDALDRRPNVPSTLIPSRRPGR